MTWANGSRFTSAWRVEIAALGVAAALSMGDAERARALLRWLDGGTPHGGRFAQGSYDFYCGWEAFVRGDVVRACALARSSIEGADACDFPFARSLGRIAAALTLRERGRSDEARALLAEAAPIVDDHGSALVRYTFLLAAADCALRDGDEARGLALLREGLRLGVERELGNMFWLTPPMAERLTERALAAGLEVPYVRRLIRQWRVRPATPPVHLADWPWPVEVRTLGRFEVRRDGAPLVFRGKAQEMPLRLLSALVALGAGEAAAATLIEALWPDADGDAGRRVLDTTLHRLRRLLGADDALVMSEGRVRLDRRIVWLDVTALEALLGRIERTGDPELAAPLLALYRGPLLPDVDGGWALPSRERLHGRTMAALMLLGRRLEEQHAYERAVELYGRSLAVDDLAEAFYCALMRCHHRLGRESEALRTYHRCERVLRSRLGTLPSSETERLRDQITAARVDRGRGRSAARVRDS